VGRGDLWGAPGAIPQPGSPNLERRPWSVIARRSLSTFSHAQSIAQIAENGRHWHSSFSTCLWRCTVAIPSFTGLTPTITPYGVLGVSLLWDMGWTGRC
jgi:hypothetical protein